MMLNTTQQHPPCPATAAAPTKGGFLNESQTPPLKGVGGCKHIIFLFFLSLNTFAQKADSTKQLNEVVVRGFETERKLSETAASVNVLTIKDIQRFENMSLVPVFNTLPGVRMEERSPGSYRLAIRGSSLRSPFGVRNVKVYWNDIPLTDGNGNTFLNSLDMNTIGNIEVIKGPAGSIYGAGTGGVVLLGGAKADGNNAQKGHTNYINTGVAYGSYGLQNRNVSWNVASEKVNSVLSYAHAQTDGYRQNSAAVRDVGVRVILFRPAKH